MVCDVVWDEIEKWIKINTENMNSSDRFWIINFSNVGSSRKPLSYIYMNSQYAFLNSLSYEQRIS
jgi:exopolyphosphatase/guanosine-5'-triphosphate,3'-diphosphate pyrophosphatase